MKKLKVVNVRFYNDKKTPHIYFMRGNSSLSASTLRKYLPEVLKRAKVDLNANDFIWNRTAGCQCGCSPGFKAKKGVEFFKYISVTTEEIL